MTQQTFTVDYGLTIIDDSPGGGSLTGGNGNVNINAEDLSNNATWTFDTSGNLTLPGNTFAVNYANGTQVDIGGGSGSNSISDGTSNVSVVSTDGNVVIGIDNDVVSWTFATDGTIYSKPETDFKFFLTDPNDDGYAIKHFINDGTQDLALTSLESGQFSIYTDLPNGGYEWRFEGDTLQVTNNSIVRGFDANVTIQSMYAGSNGTASLQSVSNNNDPNVFSTFDATTSGANIKVYNGGSSGGTEHAWLFSNTGNLTAPGNVIANTFVSNAFNVLTAGNLSITSQYGLGFTGTILEDNGDLEVYGSGSGGAIVGWTNNYNSLGNVATLNFNTVNSPSNIQVRTGNRAGTEYNWTFDNTGNLTLPGNTFAVNYANGTPVSISGGGGSGNIGNLSAFGNVIYAPGTPYPTGFVNFDTGSVMVLGTNNANSVQIVTDEQGLNNIWEFGASGNLTLPTNTANINYANGVSILAGISGGSYGNANVVANLAALGSNPISTTGNITGGNLIATANVLGNGYARFVGAFDESQASTSGLYLGYAGGTPRVMFGTGNTQQTFEIDNDGGTLRFYQPGSTKASLDANGNFSAAGNVTGANVVTGGIVSATGNVSGNYFIGNGSQLTGISTVAEASFSIQTSNFNATAGSRYGVNTTSGAVTATLPASPSTGAAIFFADAGGAYASNNLTINPNGGTIMGASGNMTVSTNNQSVGLFYNGSTWRTYNAG